MITSKPLTATITSFTLFLLITLVVIALNIYSILIRPVWYNYLTIGLLAPIGIFVFYKIFLKYKIIRLGNNQIEVNFPMLRQRKNYKLDAVQFWFENQVKTGKNSVYKELVIKFEDGKKVTLSPKESSDYERVIQYLKQKLVKKKVEVK